MSTAVVIDRRTNPPWFDRRNDTGVLPPGGVRGAQIVRTRRGRRAGDGTPVRVFTGGADQLGSGRAGQVARARRARLAS